MGGSVSKAVGKVFDATGVGQLLGGGNDQAEAMRRQAEQQQRQYEEQLKLQNEAAKLSSANTLDNITNVQTGDTLAAIDGLTSSKKKQKGASVSSALGIS